MKFINIFCILLVLSSCGKTQPIDSPKHILPLETATLAAAMKDQVNDNAHIPSLPTKYSAERYYNINSNEILPQIKGKVVLIDLWDYSCINCIHTLPHVKSWAEKYKEKGLVVIGVHTPEFDSEKQPQKLKSAIQKFGLTYPIIADNEYEIWNSLSNQYWPAYYLYDKNGILRTTHFGEGSYQEFEAFIQKILLERDSTIILPTISDK